MNDIEWLAKSAKVAALMDDESLEDAVAAIKLGATAVVSKCASVQTLIEALRELANGNLWVPPHLQAEIVARWRTPSKASLSARESEIIRCVVSGLRNAEIGEHLSIGETTVKTHLKTIFQKIGLRNRAELIRHALRRGLAG